MGQRRRSDKSEAEGIGIGVTKTLEKGLSAALLEPLCYNEVPYGKTNEEASRDCWQ